MNYSNASRQQTCVCVYAIDVANYYYFWIWALANRVRHVLIRKQQKGTSCEFALSIAQGELFVDVDKKYDRAATCSTTVTAREREREKER